CGIVWFVRDTGYLGADSLEDTRRLYTCFPALDFFEGRAIPFVVAVNRFEGSTVYAEEEIREALDVSSEVPVITADARERESGKLVLTELITHVIRSRAQW